MPNATNLQVQNYADNFTRPISERLRSLFEDITNALSLIDDVYANLTNNPTWTDGRADGPPHLLVPGDVLAWNTFCTLLLKCKAGTATLADVAAMSAQWPVILKCARGLGA
jgi:hypothetical protein